jgi:hypothetical protein
LGGALAGSVAAGLLKYFGDWSLLGVTAKYSKESAILAHERSVLLAERQNAFSIGATSHMATVAFDKHIGFCEEYVEAMSIALYTLIEGGTKEKPPGAREFFRIRQKWALWLTDEIEVKLDRFERDIAKIGADAQVLDANGTPVSNELSIKRVIADLREVLATEELTALRNELVLRSLKQPPHVV